MIGKLREKLKRFYYNLSPTYRTMRRIELKLERLKDRLDAADAKNEAMFWWGINRPGEPMSETRRRVFDGMPPAEGALREIQMGNLRILQRLKRICEENGIAYWLAAGTLLGALRHKGFIPWDDDIDVGMLREDFKRLQAALENDADYTILPYYRTDWKIYIMKMVPRDGASLCWVDILLYDLVDTKDLGSERAWEQIQRIREKNERDKEMTGRRLSRTYRDEPILGEDRRKIEKVQADNLALLPKAAHPIKAEEADCIYRSIDTVYVAGFELMPLTDVFPLTEVIFENESFNGMRESEAYLMRTYKDHLRLPPDPRPSHTV